MPATRKDDAMRIGIVGMGPVGSTLAVHLLSAGAFVIPCDIDSEKITAIKEGGIHLEAGLKKSARFQGACSSVGELSGYDLDLLVICVKTPNLEPVLKAAATFNTARLFVISAQNGIDNEVEVARHFGEDKALRMVINYAGYMSAPNRIRVSFFNPPNYVAALTPRAEPVADRFAGLLNSVGLETVIPEEIVDRVWEKAILNAALNPVCAITRRTMKDVMDYPLTRELVEAIVDESVRVAEKEGIELGRKFRRSSIRYLKKAGPHRPSMVADLESGLKTEIDYLNGKIVEYGRKHCVPTPLNFAACALVHFLETPGGPRVCHERVSRN